AARDQEALKPSDRAAQLRGGRAIFWSVNAFSRTGMANAVSPDWHFDIASAKAAMGMASAMPTIRHVFKVFMFASFRSENRPIDVRSGQCHESSGRRQLIVARLRFPQT